MYQLVLLLQKQKPLSKNKILLLKNNTKIEKITKYLRENYSLRCLIKNQKTLIFLNTSKKNKLELNVHENIFLKDLFVFLKEYNLDVDFLNNKGHYLPKNILLKDVKNYIPPLKETNEVLKSLKIISSMTNTNMYADMDWIIRLYKRVIDICSTKEEKSKILKSIKNLNISNEKFTNKDSKQLINLLK